MNKYPYYTTKKLNAKFKIKMRYVGCLTESFSYDYNRSVCK